MKSAMICLALALAMPAAAQILPVKFSSGPQRVALLELFTSEGCSSCPPADAWLNQLTNSAGLWRHFAPVAFHVDYWNSLGWRDPWSSKVFSERQQEYARLWRSENVYTPCFVLDGREWHNPFELRRAPSAPGGTPGLLDLESTNGESWSVSFAPAPATTEDFEVHAALLTGNLESKVKAGENRGRTLAHNFVAVELVHCRLITSNGVARGDLNLNTTRPASEENLAVTAWVTRAGDLEPLQAVGGWLRVKPSSEK
jgi:hypothetical protein